MTTINDVARYAGVAKKTVSRVLNNEPGVKPQTRELVKQAMATLGYVPSVSARRLAQQRANSIALGYCHDATSFPGLFQSMARLTESIATMHGIDTLLCAEGRNNEPSISKILTQFTQRSVDGAILLPPLSDDLTLVKILHEAKAPMLRIGCCHGVTEHIPSVAHHIEQAANQLATHLLQLGHRHIGVISGDSEQISNQLALEGFLSACRKHNIHHRQQFYTEANRTLSGGYQATEALLSLPQPPTAIVAFNNELAAGVLALSARWGLNIPDDLSVCCISDGSATEQQLMPVTHSSLMEESQVKTAIDEFLTSLRNAQHQPQINSLQPRLNDHGTTAKL
ncbi:LacI family DNA-binding transcriptional regulator [Aestuariibacter salexigens]|uniref:LacI family DNA-binding transcriptional regulator n=1 Tax=Aestuariibacter salexigens TaxID=226010 RepID=UPI000428A16F|nr:LacI family DNA-binding transcriptional regulator [Aestuariibacter salexigens]